MRAILIVLLTGLVISPTSRAGETAPEVRCPAGEAPELDGRISEGEWQDAVVVHRMGEPWAYDAIEGRAEPEYDPTEFAAEIRMKHDGQRLYILAKVRDDTIYAIDTPEWAPSDC